MADVTVTGPGTNVVVSSSTGAILVADTQRPIAVGTALHFPAGSAATGANVGGGDAEVYRDKVGSILNFRTVSGENGITVSENGNVIEIDGAVLQNVLLSHADRHKHGGGDEVASATPGANLIPKADGTGKLDSGWMPTGTFTDEAVSVTSNDTTPGYLDDKIVAGAGLTRTVLNPAGDEDYQLDVVANADGSIVVNANDIQVGVLASDAQHGDRGGGSVHAVAIASGAAGFLSGADKQLIDDLGTTYAPIVHASRHAGGAADPITSLGAHSVTGQLELTGTDNLIYLNSADSNMVSWNTEGIGAPTFTTRSDGTKIVLYPLVGATRVDWGIGIESSHTWFSTPAATSAYGFKWYGGETMLLRLSGDGLLQFGGQTNTEAAWKRSGTTLEAVLADESGQAGLSCGTLGIGTLVVPHASVGYAKVAIEGTNTSADGPHVQFTVDTDDYPNLQVLPYGHDSVHLAFDCYYDGGWKSSDAGSNFGISKVNDTLRLRYDSGVAAGNAVTWSNGIILDTSGDVTIGGSVTATDFDLSGGSSLATHATRHENGGSDEISVAGLSGLLADGQTPLAHETTHRSGGTDELSHNNLVDLTTGDVHTHYALLAGRSGGQALYGGTAAADSLDLWPNSVSPPTDLTTHGKINVNGRVLFQGFTDMDGSTALSNWALMQHAENCDVTGSNQILVGGFSYSPVIEYDTPQLFGGGATFQDASKWDEMSALGGAHSFYSLACFLGNIRYRMQHAGTATPPTSLAGFNSAPSADALAGTMTLPEVIGFQTNAVFGLKAFLSTEEFRNGVTVTKYVHFLANSNITNGLSLQGGSTITTEIGLDLQNIAHGSTAISIRSDAAGAYMTHAGHIRLNHQSNQLQFGTAQDTAIGRVGANILGMPAGDSFRLTDTGSLQFINAAQQITGTSGELLLTAATVRTSAELEIDGTLDHDGASLGFYGATPVAQSAAYAPTNVSTDRAYDANATTIDELADVLGTLIADLQATGIIG